MNMPQSSICPPSSPVHSSASSSPTILGRGGGSSMSILPNNNNHPQQTFNNNGIVESIQSTFNNIRNHLKSNGILPNNNDNDNTHHHLLLPTFLSGTFAFYATSFSSQAIQHKLLKISTGTRPALLPISVGVLTVAVGSWMGHLAGLGTTAAWGNVQNSWKEHTLVENFPKIGKVAVRSVQEMTRPMKLMFAENNISGLEERSERREAWMHAARICIIGLLTYKTIFRSNFYSLSPSSYTARGSFARIGIPAPPNFNYATKVERQRLERIGKWWGCHTCGSRMYFSNIAKNKPKFHGDHIPPVSVAKQLNNRWYRRKLGIKVSQKFYPQCRDCSNKQGGMLSRAIREGHKNLRAVGGGEESYFHGRRLRIGHLTGGAVAIATVENNRLASWNDGNDIDDSTLLVKASRERVHSFQTRIEDLVRELKRRVVDVSRTFR
eukprot:CAMPEP_0183708344 /NCGR_PEP_ID=MMETSP0737-20130205/4689_1 /TAXON_ID=385413 /ORGANISM="Thalassiosira miniscula, Strain CCMP1093" /LENGTH=436 /DNA_ID=CAMNT_0025936209 /DNA_START=82 /DNA_END=1392 /DNA_ORIENTATION=+